MTPPSDTPSMTAPTKAYPETITAEMLPEWAAISDAEVANDIRDTEVEISTYTRLGSPSEVAPREAFVAFLRRLQAAREVFHVSS